MRRLKFQRDELAVNVPQTANEVTCSSVQKPHRVC